MKRKNRQKGKKQSLQIWEKQKLYSLSDENGGCGRRDFLAKGKKGTGKAGLSEKNRKNNERKGQKPGNTCE